MKGRVEGVEGYASDATAKKAAGMQAAGGIAGAGLLALLIPGVGALAGLAVAVYAVTKAIFKYRAALAAQAEFKAFEKLGASADKASESLDAFVKQEGFTAQGLGRVTKDMESYGQDLQSTVGVSMASARAQRVQPTAVGIGGGAAVGAAIGAWLAPFTMGLSIIVGAAIGAIVGGFTEYIWKGGSKAGRQEDALMGANRTLEMVTDKMVDQMGTAFEKISDDFIKGLPDTTDTLGKMASLLSTVEAGAPTLSETQVRFEELSDVLSESGERGKAFADFMKQKLFVGMLESIKGGSDEAKRLFSGAASLNIDVTDIAALRDNVSGLTDVTGDSVEATHLAIDAYENFARMQMDQIVQTIAYKAKMEQLNRVMKIAARSVKLFVTALEVLATMGEQAASRFGLFGSELEAFASKTLSGDGGILAPQRSFINPFKNLETSTAAAIQGGLDKITSVSGTDLTGMGEVLKLRKKLPEITQDLVRRVEADPSLQGKIATAPQLLEQLKATLSDMGIVFDQLPEQVQKNLRSGLQRSMSRQGAGATIRDIVEGEDFQGLIGRFGDASEKARQALEKFYKSVTDAQKTLIGIINQEIKLEEYRIEQSKRIVGVLHATADVLDNFRIKTDHISDAEGRLLDRLNAIDGGRGTVTLSAAQQQQEVQSRRDQNKELRDAIVRAGGPAIGADMTVAQIEEALASSGTLLDNNVQLRSLIDQLRMNEKAMIRETKKLDELIEESDRLGAINQTLSDVQKAQMGAEEQARFFVSQLARIEGEPDPIRRGQMLQELMLPFTAWSKALAGGTLNMREFAALLNNFESRIAPVLRSMGFDAEEIESAKRALFNQFTTTFPQIIGEAISQSFVAIGDTSSFDLAIKQIQKSMETAGMNFVDITANEFPGLFRDAIAAFGFEAGNSVQSLFDTAEAIAKRKAEAMLAESEAKMTAVREAIEQQVGQFAKDTEKINEHKAALEAATKALTGENGFVGELGTLMDAFESAGSRANALFDTAFEAAQDEEEQVKKIGDIKSYMTYEKQPKTDRELKEMLLNDREMLVDMASGMGYSAKLGSDVSSEDILAGMMDHIKYLSGLFPEGTEGKSVSEIFRQNMALMFSQPEFDAAGNVTNRIGPGLIGKRSKEDIKQEYEEGKITEDEYNFAIQRRNEYMEAMYKNVATGVEYGKIEPEKPKKKNSWA